jgi:hypothetical protein
MSQKSSLPVTRADGLLFEWSRTGVRWRSVLFWTANSAVILAAFAAFFRLEGMVQAKRLSQNHSIILLDAGTDAVAPLLDRAADHSFLALGSGVAVALEQDAAKGLPRFRPGFQDATLSIKTRPEDSPKQRAFPQIVSSAGVFPPVPQLQLSSDTQALPASIVFWAADGELAQRPILKQPNFSPSLAALAAETSFHVGVDHHGRVIFALPLNPVALSAADQEALHAKVDQLRFAQRSGAAVQWGSLTLQSRPQ